MVAEGDLKIGDVVFGKNSEAEVPVEGGKIDHFMKPDGVYLNHINGGGIGNRWIEELVWDEDKEWPKEYLK